MGHAVFVQIVTFNHAPFIESAVNACLAQEGFTPGLDLFLHITDNASQDETVSILQQRISHKALVHLRSANIGFAGAHNEAIGRFLKSECDYYLCLNPDLRLKADALREMRDALIGDRKLGFVTPKLLRADDKLEALSPPRLDAAGMYFDSSLRHLDRASGALDQGQYEKVEEVFGASGAAVLFRRECIIDLLLESAHESDASKLYPALALDGANRPKFFDEAFFAYREDAELCWRARWRGWSCHYIPRAVGYHRRYVLPERRAGLSTEINSSGVRNRFLMQLVNYTPSLGLSGFVRGFFLRNLTVIAAVFLIEHSSIKGLKECISLLRRALERRKYVFLTRRASGPQLASWFNAGAK